MAEISQLVPYSYPVFQAIRPNIMYHSVTGQNTGSQGKGPTREQARLSAIMESIEAYCAEPRNALPLIRGCFDYLQVQHVVIHPQYFTCREGAAPSGNEAFMWTEGCELNSSRAMLLPAELAFFPFLPSDYCTRSCFPCGSNGLASGGTYLEAVVHGLYELIERHYVALREDDRLIVRRFHLNGLIDLAEFAHHAPDMRIAVYALTIPGIDNVPMVMAVISDVELGRSFAGFGCCFDADVAVSRAVSEAWQSMATVSSGAREDIVRTDKRRDKTPELPPERTLHIDEYRREVLHRTFDSLRDELSFTLRWLSLGGYGVVCAANLTRIGIDVPVVKVVVPGLRAPRRNLRASVMITTTEVHRTMHRAVK